MVGCATPSIKTNIDSSNGAAVLKVKVVVDPSPVKRFSTNKEELEPPPAIVVNAIPPPLVLVIACPVDPSLRFNCAIPIELMSILALVMVVDAILVPVTEPSIILSVLIVSLLITAAEVVPER